MDLKQIENVNLKCKLLMKNHILTWSRIFQSNTIISMMEFIANTRGGKKLCYAGHSYTLKAKSKTTQRWECAQRRGKDCRGVLTTDLDVSNYIISLFYKRDQVEI